MFRELCHETSDGAGTNDDQGVRIAHVHIFQAGEHGSQRFAEAGSLEGDIHRNFVDAAPADFLTGYRYELSETAGSSQVCYFLC